MSDADICLILEGTYPYVTGGVAQWTHDLIHSQPDVSFTLVCILPRESVRKHVMRFPLTYAQYKIFTYKSSHPARPLFLRKR